MVIITFNQFDFRSDLQSRT